MAIKTTNAYAAIIKMDENPDGTLTVFGKATDSGLDIDQQICDPAWLDRAMPEWFMTGGNIREQHSNIAAGVAQEYEQKADGHYISALVVDPISVKKVRSRVLKGFSIGIKSPRVVKDQKAANGRIIDGQIVEVSLVDRPANPNCQLILAKSVSGKKSLAKVEELVETNIEKDSQTEEMPMSGEAKNVPSRDEMVQRYAAARKALDEVTRMCKECGYHDIEKQYGETAEEETAEGPMVGQGQDAAQHELEETKAAGTDGCDCEGCKMCKESGGCDSKMCKGHKSDKELVAEDGEEELKSATHKCLECGCNQPANSHGNPNVSTAVMVSAGDTPVPTPAIQPPTPKSATTITPLPTVETIGSPSEQEDFDEDDSLKKSLLANVNIKDIVENAVKSAMASVEAQVAELKSAKEAVENKAAELESELATAKSLAIGGGPKRTTIATGAKTNNEWRAKADLYFAKAASTTDQILAKGYRDLAKDFLAKATPAQE